MNKTQNKSVSAKYMCAVILTVIIMLQLIAALYFSVRKTGCHYDEYYSYYSSNVSAGLSVPDNGWMDGTEIRNEFMVLSGEGYNYGMVKLMQTYDVHPPMYYYILHTVCSFTPGVFSKWQGLSINIFLYILTIILLFLICRRLYGSSDDDSGSSYIPLIITVALYGFSPAILSGVMFIRMYSMLTFLCFLTIYVHLNMLNAFEEYIENNASESGSNKKITKRQIGYAVGLLALSFIGIMTHYYYVVFLFFTAAYTAIRLLVIPLYRGDKRIDIKNAVGYSATVVLALVLSVIYYPAMLSHIFRGYRGTEATQAFFDIGNLRERAGLFIGLLDEYLLCRSFYVLILLILLIYVYRRYRLGNNGSYESNRMHNGGLIYAVTIGYFLVVLKTALLNAEEAVRYEMPVYGLIIMIIVCGLWNLLYVNKRQEEDGPNNKIGLYVFAVIMSVVMILQIFNLMTGKVLFTYEGDSEGIAWAAEHRDDTIVYVYNPTNPWMIWDDSMELMQYDRVYFVSADNDEEIKNPDVLNSDQIYVYAVRSDAAEGKIDQLLQADSNVTSSGIIRELQYADIYELR